MARPVYTPSVFHNIAFGLAFIPNYETKEFEEEVDGGENSHELTAKHVIKICLVELLNARFVIGSYFQHNRDHHQCQDDDCYD